MEILNLQSSLQAEIQAKESIREELTQIRADFIAMQKYDSFIHWQLTTVFHSIPLLFILLLCREMWEVKQQREELARELVRKDGQVKEMQQRLESGDGGCKCSSFSISLSQCSTPQHQGRAR